MLYEGKMIQALKSIAPNFNYVLSDRNGVEPAAPYVLVSILNKHNIGDADKTHVSNSKKQIVQQDVRVIFRLTLHALATDVAQDQYETMHHGLTSSIYVYNFYQQGLGVSNIGDITYSSAPVDSKTYKRASIDITCLTNRINEYDTPDINQVNIHGDFTDKSNNETEIDIIVDSP